MMISLYFFSTHLVASEMAISTRLYRHTDYRKEQIRQLISVDFFGFFQYLIATCASKLYNAGNFKKACALARVFELKPIAVQAEADNDEPYVPAPA